MDKIKIRLNPDIDYYNPEANQSLITDLKAYLIGQDNHFPIRGLWIVAEEAGKKLFQQKFTDCFLRIEKLEGFVLQMPKSWLDQFDQIKTEYGESGEPTGNDLQISNGEHYKAIMNLENTAGYITLSPLNFNELKEHFDVGSETPNIFSGKKKNALISTEYTQTNEEV